MKEQWKIPGFKFWLLELHVFGETEGFCGVFSTLVVYNSYCYAQVFYLFLIIEANALLSSYAEGTCK